jgi:sugar/nucleoside kinase (ribokinase family)
MDKKVCLIGDINIDINLKGINDLSEIKLGTEFKMKDYVMDVGGSGFNTIMSLKNFGLSIDLFSKIGGDFFGEKINKYLKENDINNSIITQKDLKTGLAVVLPVNNNRVILSYNGSNEFLKIDDIDFEKVINSDHVHLSSYYLLSGLHENYIELLQRIKSTPHITTSFDTGYDPQEKWQREKIFKILKYVDIFFPNEIEILNITNSDNIEEALKILSKACKTVIVKIGKKGLAAISEKHTNNEIVYLETYDVKVVDTTNCGDCFNAGFIYGFLNNYSFMESLELANACGSFQAGKLGNYKFKNLDEINNFMLNYKTKP